MLLLDIIEHLRAPEEFMASLRASTNRPKDTTFILSTGNVGFIVTRMMLLLGSFNYGARGILDLTHTRLFMFSSLRQLLEQTGYQIEEVRGIPAPFPLALGENTLARIVLNFNKLLIRISKPLFSYQIFMVARPLPTMNSLLRTSVEASIERVSKGRTGVLAAKAKAVGD